MNYETLLIKSFEAVYKSALPDHCIGQFIPDQPENGKLIVIGAGKASAAMAAAFENAYQGDLSGVVVTRYGHSIPTRKIKILEAAHPVPDDAGVAAVNQIIKVLEEAEPNDLVVCLISGGGSALLTAPIDGISFENLQALNSQLLKSGASIHEINAVRKHLNKALGGGLAQISRAEKIITLAISDVTGDDPSIIASGATVADPSTLEDAIGIWNANDIQADHSIVDALENPENETPKPNNPIFENNEYHLIATPKKSLEAAAKYWNEKGFHTHVFDAEMEGDTNDAALSHIEFIQKIYACEIDIPLPCALISGGETTVKVKGNGDGGPNTQFMLQAAIVLNGHEKVFALSCDTDGIDGSADNAGAYITPQTLNQASQNGLNAQEYLDNNDSYNFFNAIDGLVKTGPTHTNVNDYRVFLLLP